GRSIGDEFRYVLDRRNQKKYPGNMLDRPQLLLNPWAVRSTETGEQLAQGGESFGATGTPPSTTPAPAPSMEPSPKGAAAAAVDQTTFLDFLADESTLFTNLVPKNNALVIDMAALGSHQF